MHDSLERAVHADPDELLTPEEVSELVKLDEKTLANKRWRRTGPAYIKLGAGRGAPVRYRRSAITQWLDAQTVAA